MQKILILDRVFEEQMILIIWYMVVLVNWYIMYQKIMVLVTW